MRRVWDVYGECKTAVAQRGASFFCIHPWQHVPGLKVSPSPHQSLCGGHTMHEAAGGCRPVVWGGPSLTTASCLISSL